jgi:hypothetical protein
MPRLSVSGDGKKAPLNMRTTPQLRAKLEAAAAASGRSLVQEVEYRLEVSFAGDASIGARFASLQRMIDLALRVASSDSNADRVAQRAISIICEAFFKGGLTVSDYKDRLAVAAVLQDREGDTSGWTALGIASAILVTAGLLPELALQRGTE